MAGLEFYGQLNLLKGGILYADLLNTVSTTHSSEIQTQAFGCGLDGVLRTRAGRFSGHLRAACGGRFTLRRPLSAKPLTHCPACKKPVRKIISSFNTPTITKPVSISDAKKAGFSVLKRVNKGEYERQ